MSTLREVLKGNRKGTHAIIIRNRRGCGAVSFELTGQS